MISFKAGDIVLVRFPFTDLSSTKKRPAVIVNTQEYATRYHDYILVPLTSVQQAGQCALSCWKEAGLLKPTWAKAMIVTLSDSVLIKTIGHLHNEDVSVVSNLIREVIAQIRSPYPYPNPV
jgi:mRNA interferase MazF